jgi:CRP-like cAMP-binding protein
MRLDSVPLLEGLDKEAIEFIADHLQEVSVPIGGHIVKAGDYAYHFFIILEGSAAVSQAGELVAALGPGDVFGEMALLQDLRRNADVVAVTPMQIAALMSWDFRELALRFPDFQRRVDEVVIRRSAGPE